MVLKGEGLVFEDGLIFGITECDVGISRLLIKKIYFVFALIMSFSCAYCQELCHPSIQIMNNPFFSDSFHLMQKGFVFTCI